MVHIRLLSCFFFLHSISIDWIQNHLTRDAVGVCVNENAQFTQWYLPFFFFIQQNGQAKKKKLVLEKEREKKKE